MLTLKQLAQRVNNLFFYLGSGFTNTLIDIEENFLRRQVTTIEKEAYKKLNNAYLNFSHYYFSLSWKVRANLQIENNQFLYKKRFKMDSVSDKLEYYLHPKQIVKNLSLFLVILSFIYLIASTYFPTLKETENIQLTIQMYLNSFVLLYCVLVPIRIILHSFHSYFINYNFYKNIIISIKQKIFTVKRPKK